MDSWLKLDDTLPIRVCWKASGPVGKTGWTMRFPDNGGLVIGSAAAGPSAKAMPADGPVLGGLDFEVLEVPALVQ